MSSFYRTQLPGEKPGLVIANQVRLKKRLTKFILGGLLLTLAAVTYGSYRTIRFWVLEQLRQENLLETQKNANRIDQWFAFYKTKAITIAQMPLIQTMNWQVMEAYLNTEVDRLKPVANDAILINPDGTYYFTGIGFVEGKNLTDRPYFQAAMAGETVVSEPIISRASGVHKVNIVVPIGEGQSPEGIFTLGIKIDSIQETFQSLNQDSESYVFVLDSQGRAIAHPNPGLIFNQDQPDPPTLMNRAQATANLEMVAVLEQMLDRQTGNRLLKLDGQWYYITYLPLQEVDWSIALVVPRTTIDGQLRSLDQIALAAGALIVALIFALGLWQAQMGRNQALQVLQENTAATNQKLEAKTTELRQALLDLQQAQSQLIQNEKMASIGQLTAGIAHEINNPINFVHGNLAHVQTHANDLLELIGFYQSHYPNPSADVQRRVEQYELTFIQADLPKVLESMEIGTNRIREIVSSLRTFSRTDEVSSTAVDIHGGIDSTLRILQHRLIGLQDCQGIQVLKFYGKLPLVDCYIGPLNQVFMNILANAIDALEESNVHRSQTEIEAHPNQIQIQTAAVRENWVEVTISDNGPGIPQDVQRHICDPFFTTKPIGKGTGMGMYISYQIIVEKHGGKLDCESVLGQGTTFRIQLPITQS